ncbi:hypothetical protein SORBI_3005G043300 [Sorghum bicolor]|uniref:Uncharacterized protein n=1 Tax=Sorghum bicolor TaxID=4558 RepID=A0A1B6PQ46_SORBI|nr:hypothetical protein SORBI_3005G043300 [Sorghum bicolor]
MAAIGCGKPGFSPAPCSHFNTVTKPSDRPCPCPSRRQGGSRGACYCHPNRSCPRPSPVGAADPRKPRTGGLRIRRTTTVRPFLSLAVRVVHRIRIASAAPRQAPREQHCSGHMTPHGEGEKEESSSGFVELRCPATPLLPAKDPR